MASLRYSTIMENVHVTVSIDIRIVPSRWPSDPSHEPCIKCINYTIPAYDYSNRPRPHYVRNNGFLELPFFVQPGGGGYHFEPIPNDIEFGGPGTAYTTIDRHYPTSPGYIVNERRHPPSVHYDTPPLMSCAGVSPTLPAQEPSQASAPTDASEPSQESAHSAASEPSSPLKLPPFSFGYHVTMKVRVEDLSPRRMATERAAPAHVHDGPVTPTNPPDHATPANPPDHATSTNPTDQATSTNPPSHATTPFGIIKTILRLVGRVLTNPPDHATPTNPPDHPTSTNPPGHATTPFGIIRTILRLVGRVLTNPPDHATPTNPPDHATSTNPPDRATPANPPDPATPDRATPANPPDHATPANPPDHATPDHATPTNPPDHATLTNPPDHATTPFGIIRTILRLVGRVSPNPPDHAIPTNPPDHATSTNPPDHATSTNPPDHATSTNPPDHATSTNPPSHATTPFGIIRTILRLVGWVSTNPPVRATPTNSPDQAAINHTMFVVNHDINMIQEFLEVLLHSPFFYDSLCEMIHNIDRMGAFEYFAPAVDVTEMDTDSMCCICLGKLMGGEVTRRIRCKHYFHRDCLDSWLMNHPGCPLCRTNVLPKPV